MPSAKPSATETAVASLSPAAPTHPADQPPKPAVIESGDGTLTIRADNASLNQTLQQVAEKTGMHLEGIGGDQRIFGDFGPGAPNEVLSALLSGSGYNLVMVGALDNGAPRKLLLSTKQSRASSPANGLRQNVDQPSDDDTGDIPVDDQPQPPPPMMMPPRGGEGPNGRTPQQMQEQFQQLRQQMEQQQQQQQ